MSNVTLANLTCLNFSLDKVKHKSEQKSCKNMIFKIFIFKIIILNIYKITICD